MADVDDGRGGALATVAFNRPWGRILRFIGALLAVPLHDILRFRDDAFGSHSDPEALTQTALLTLAPHVHIDVAIVAILASVH